jgi:hypothetical protein
MMNSHLRVILRIHLVMTVGTISCRQREDHVRMFGLV